ncbi:MAG: hypothetical protein GY858_01655 [Candidatus Omnitrophica bacterium]|nr:hypothetical protein [Candidatus Omnitrophota bacterium]
MKRNIFIVMILLLIPVGQVFPQGAIDNIYGDYIISNEDITVSLDLEGARLITVLKMLSRQTGLNFLSTEVVQERALTLYMTDVPLKDAMDIIFKANNLIYDFYPESNIFVVKELGKPKIELETKVFYLKYTRVGSSRLLSERDSALGSSCDSDSSDAELEGSTDDGASSQGSQLLSAVEKVLSDYGDVVEDTYTNSLVVTDVPSQFSVIEKVISQLDLSLQQVMIEVEILDVSKQLVDEFGFKYGTPGGNWGQYTPGTKTSGFPFPDRLGGAGGTVTTGTLNLRGFVTAVQFLTSDTTTKFLARPKILTLANETAEVNLTVDEVVGILNTFDDAGNIVGQEAERAETGTKLRVTPQVNPLTKEITLFVTVFSKEAKDSGIDVNGENAMNIEERGTKCMVRLKDGETLLLGGLIKKEGEEVKTKVPLLGEIPLLGRLFKSREKDGQERELMVFLTPRVIKDKSILSEGGRILCREQDNPEKMELMKIALDKLSK